MCFSTLGICVNQTIHIAITVISTILNLNTQTLKIPHMLVKAVGGMSLPLLRALRLAR